MRLSRRHCFFLLAMLTVAASSVAEERFRWKGRVDGVDELLIQGRSFRVNHLEAKPIQRQDHRFSDRLPARDVEVELNVIKGRGSVRLMEQPSERNDYTVVVRIEDDQGGDADYELELVWDDDDDWDDDWDDEVRWSDDTDGDGGVFHWEGRVDIGARIEIHGDRHTVIDQGGRGVFERRARFESPLPNSEVPVSLRKRDGRGDVELVQSPSEDNDFTAIVMIEDDKSGSDDYEFELSWN